MDSARGQWPEIDRLLQEVLEVPPVRREAVLARACGDDAGLRREIESLIRADEEAGDFMAHPALADWITGRGRDSRPDRPSVLHRLFRQLGVSSAIFPGLPPDREEPLAAGTVVAHRFRIVGLLGRGGMGEVYRADDLKLGEPVALKFLSRAMARDETMLSRFLEEVKIARRITHLNVCRVYDVGEVDGRPFLSMEHIDGEDLGSLLQRRGRPPRHQAMEILRQLCRGLAAVHREGILHRDLKPSNLMIDGTGRARITDFGIAGLAGSDGGSQLRHGTPAYMAPEQLAGREVSVRSDLFALGLVMYELMTGKRAYAAESASELSRLYLEAPPARPSSLVEGLEPAVERVILECLENDPRDRPSSVDAVATALFGGPARLAERREPAPPLHQLPPPPADFTGRKAELAELRKAVEHDGAAIVGVQGMGGLGKTALALKLAEELAPLFPDGQIYLDLQGASPEPLSSQQVMQHVIHSFRPEAQLPETETELAAHYRSVLHGRRPLLLLDNAAGRGQVEPLIAPRGCLMLITSRRSLALPGQVVKNLDVLEFEDAVALLRRIVSRIGGEAEEIARLCACLPIALRLAGGTLAERRDTTPAEYARRLADGRERLELIEASLTLSYELLTSEQQALWRRLAVFPANFDRAAVAAVWNVEPEEVGDPLSEMVTSGLVEWTDSRYRLHDLARLFAEHRLDNGEEAEARRRHAEHYLKTLQDAEELYLQGGEKVRLGLRILDREWANIEAGRAWSQACAGDDLSIAKLCSDYPQTGSRCLWIRLPTAEQLRCRKAACEAARMLDDRAALAHHLAHLGRVQVTVGEARQGLEACQQALAVSRQVGCRRTELLCLCLLGEICYSLGELRRSLDCHQHGLAIAREIGDRRAESQILCGLSTIYSDVGESRPAIELFDQALGLAREVGNKHAESTILANLGWAHLVIGETRRAVRFLKQALDITSEMGFRKIECHILGNLARCYLDLGEPRRALELNDQARAIASEIGSRRLEGHALATFGSALRDLGQPRRAVELLEQSIAITREVGDRFGESYFSWLLGLHWEEAGDLSRAAALMQARVDFERSFGHADAETHAARVEEIRARIRDSALPQRPPMAQPLSSATGDNR